MRCLAAVAMLLPIVSASGTYQLLNISKSLSNESEGRKEFRRSPPRTMQINESSHYWDAQSVNNMVVHRTSLGDCIDRMQSKRLMNRKNGQVKAQMKRMNPKGSSQSSYKKTNVPYCMMSHQSIKSKSTTRRIKNQFFLTLNTTSQRYHKGSDNEFANSGSSLDLLKDNHDSSEHLMKERRIAAPKNAAPYQTHENSKSPKMDYFALSRRSFSQPSKNSKKISYQPKSKSSQSKKTQKNHEDAQHSNYGKHSDFTDGTKHPTLSQLENYDLFSTAPTFLSDVPFQPTIPNNSNSLTPFVEVSNALGSAPLTTERPSFPQSEITYFPHSSFDHSIITYHPTSSPTKMQAFQSENHYNDYSSTISESLQEPNRHSHAYSPNEMMDCLTIAEGTGTTHTFVRYFNVEFDLIILESFSPQIIASKIGHILQGRVAPIVAGCRELLPSPGYIRRKTKEKNGGENIVNVKFSIPEVDEKAFCSTIKPEYTCSPTRTYVAVYYMGEDGKKSKTENMQLLLLSIIKSELSWNEIAGLEEFQDVTVSEINITSQATGWIQQQQQGSHQFKSNSAVSVSLLLGVIVPIFVAGVVLIFHVRRSQTYPFPFIRFAEETTKPWYWRENKEEEQVEFHLEQTENHNYHCTLPETQLRPIEIPEEELISSKYATHNLDLELPYGVNGCNDVYDTYKASPQTRHEEPVNSDCFVTVTNDSIFKEDQHVCFDVNCQLCRETRRRKARLLSTYNNVYAIEVMPKNLNGNRFIEDTLIL